MRNDACGSLVYLTTASSTGWLKENPYLNNKKIEYHNMYTGKRPFDIEKVIFNPPATIVYWTDGIKTVVKVQNGERFDCEKGLAMAIAKKALGNQGNYFNQIKKWTE